MTMKEDSVGVWLMVAVVALSAVVVWLRINFDDPWPMRLAFVPVFFVVGYAVSRVSYAPSVKFGGTMKDNAILNGIVWGIWGVFAYTPSLLIPMSDNIYFWQCISAFLGFGIFGRVLQPMATNYNYSQFYKWALRPVRPTVVLIEETHIHAQALPAPPRQITGGRKSGIR